MKLYHNPDIKEWTPQIIEEIFTMEDVSIKMLDDTIDRDNLIIDYLTSEYKPWTLLILPIQYRKWCFVIVHMEHGNGNVYPDFWYRTSLFEIIESVNPSAVYPILMSEEDFNTYLPYN